MTTWSELLDEAAGVLGSKPDARRLVEEASGLEGAELVLALNDTVPARSGAYLTRMVERRAAGEPLQYVIGRWGFRRLDLMVDRRVLIPRPETEQVVAWALDEARALQVSELAVADLGTGSGAIALSLAVELGPDVTEVWATDISADALDVTQANLAGIGTWAAPRVRVAEGSWWEALPETLAGRLHVVVSNPPYVADDEPLPAEVESFEPALALRGGREGLDAIRTIVAGAPRWLRRPGVLVVELAPGQAGAAVELARAAGAARAEIRADLAGRDRALVAAWEAA